MKKYRKYIFTLYLVLMVSFVFCTSAYAAPTGDVAGAIEGTWRMGGTGNFVYLPRIYVDRTTLCWQVLGM